MNATWTQPIVPDRAARRAVIALTACAALFQVRTATQGSSRALVLSPCTVPGLSQPARCGALEVPEDPNRPNGRRISIGVAVVSAVNGRALPDPIALLMGGPGEDAISAAGLFARQLAPLLGTRDLLLVDQRGTGRSNRLNCDLFAGVSVATALRDLFPAAEVGRCAKQLQARADLTQYTFANFANDLERVRRALGYGPLNLFAGSYGTRAAQVFLRAYPQSVRTVYLGSVVPVDVATPLTMAKTGQKELESTIAACAADSACREAFPTLNDELRMVTARLDSQSARVLVPGSSDPVTLDRGRVAEWFRSRLYRPATAAAVPWLIDRAAHDDWQPIADGILANARGLGTELSLGVFFSITCNEDIAFVRDEVIERETRGTFLGDYRVRQQQAACKSWPATPLADRNRSPVKSATPALFVSGDLDGASPLWFTDRVAGGFSNRAEVVLRGRGHTEWSECLATIYEQFVRDAGGRGLDLSSCQPIRRPPFKTS